jgi:hypothetical protein
MAPKKKPQEKPRIGRPPVTIDADNLRKLSALRCTVEEAATFFKTVKRTLLRRLKDDPELKAAWENGKNEGRIALKRLQWRHAQLPNSAGVQMTIHLSKHELGEHDRQLNLNMTVDDLDEAIRELEHRSGETEEPAGDEGEHSEAEAAS